MTGTLPSNIASSKKYGFITRVHKFVVLIGDVLFMRGVDMSLRRVPWKEEVYRIWEANHEGSCGGHFAFRITLHKILQEGYVCPSIQKDVNHWCRS